MSTDVPELDFREYIEARRGAVDAALTLGRRFLAEARKRHAEAPTPESRFFLVLSIATVEVGEAERDALDVEFA